MTELRLRGQTETIPMTTFFTPKTDGIYRVSAYMVVTVPGAQGCSDFFVLIVSWTDESGVNTEATCRLCVVSEEVPNQPLLHEALQESL